MMLIKKITCAFTLMLLCVSATAKNNLTTSKSIKKVARNIPYESGKKSTQISNAELALDKHPMISSALNGVINSTNYCILYQFDSEKHSQDEIRNTQFNGGEIKVIFTYFCYHQEKTKNNDQSQVMADVVLYVKGDYSETNKEIYDPDISYSKCYGHFCGSI